MQKKQQEGGHLFERPGQDKKLNSCIDSDKHNNDAGDALKYIGKWIMSFTGSDDK